MTAVDKMEAELVRQDWSDRLCSPLQMSCQIGPQHPDLVLALIEDRTRTTAQMSAPRRDWISDQLFKIGLS